MELSKADGNCGLFNKPSLSFSCLILWFVLSLVVSGLWGSWRMMSMARGSIDKDKPPRSVDLM